MATPRTSRRGLRAIQADVPTELHRRLRIEAAKRCTTIKATIVAVLDASLPAEPREDAKETA